MKRIVVLGAGESGTGAAILAKAKGMEVFVSDMGAISPVYQALLDQHQIAWESGKHTPELILNADEVIKSPGIPLTAPLVKQLIEQGTPKHTHIVCPISSAYAVEYLQKNIDGEHVTLWVAAIDEELTSKSYIVPGLGDAGDLAYGIKK